MVYPLLGQSTRPASCELPHCQEKAKTSLRRLEALADDVMWQSPGQQVASLCL